MCRAQLEDIKDQAQRNIEALLTDVHSSLGQVRQASQNGFNAAEMRPRLERAISQLQSGLIERDTEVSSGQTCMPAILRQLDSTRSRMHVYPPSGFGSLDRMHISNVSMLDQDCSACLGNFAISWASNSKIAVTHAPSPSANVRLDMLRLRAASNAGPVALAGCHERRAHSVHRPAWDCQK